MPVFFSSENARRERFVFHDLIVHDLRSCPLSGATGVVKVVMDGSLDAKITML